MTDWAAGAVIAFFAAGANALAAMALLILHSDNDRIRWYVLFVAGIVAWLVIQGWAFAAGAWSELAAIHRAIVLVLPALFLCFALAESGRALRERLAVLAGAALIVIVDAFGFSALVLPWHIAGWVGGALILAHATKTGPAPPPTKRRLRRAVLIGLNLPVPLAVAASLIAGGQAFFIYVLPLLTVGIQILLFVGMVHLQFYDIEVRVARTGELAAGAAEAERLAALGELAASVAHEVRNPLTGVRSLAQRIAEDEVDEGRRRRYAAVILDEVGRVERLVTDLLALARRTPVREATTSVRLGALFEDLALLLSARAARGGVRIDLDDGGLNRQVPREPLAQVLLNLLLNAIGHSPAAGRVLMSARELGGDLEISVRDQGPGIPAAEREKIFDPFHSGSGGSGLGLAVARRVAQERGWEIEARDGPGGGAEMVVRVRSTAAPSSTDGGAVAVTTVAAAGTHATEGDA